MPERPSFPVVREQEQPISRDELMQAAADTARRLLGDSGTTATPKNQTTNEKPSVNEKASTSESVGLSKLGGWNNPLKDLPAVPSMPEWNSKAFKEAASELQKEIDEAKKPLAVASKEMDDMQKSTLEMKKFGQDLMIKRDHEPFLSKPVIICSGLSPLGVGLSGTAPMHTLLRSVGAGTLGGFGAYQGYKDYRNLLNADSRLESLRFGTAIGLDAGIVAGSALTVSRYGPKWLGPAVLIGSVAARGALDLFPDSKR